MTRTNFLCALVAVMSLSVATAIAQERTPNRQIKEPVFRVVSTPKSHPMDPALRFAKHGLERCRKDITDYTATMIKRERVNGELLPAEYMFCKFRNGKVAEEKTVVPFSVYMKFLKPSKKKGREVIWIEGENDGKLIAHGSGPIESKFKVKLDPDGKMAMEDNRYPIYDAGIENLIVKLIQKGEEIRKLGGNCEVKYFKNATINKRSCTLIEVRHPKKLPGFDYHLARIYVDDEMQIPIRFASWYWPEVEGGNPQLLEEYTYLNVKLNVGLTNLDFDPDNPNYKYPY